MCGLVAVFERDGRPVPPPVLRAMTGALAHRGPDGEGYWHGPGVGLGHRRLAVIDPADGAQPMAAGDLRVVFNGEI
ncbi:MAG: asparagine synthetase B, partial [Myxococcales bacterium]|nr:asparagine synthetase B [Myxococcales bacterium]